MHPLVHATILAAAALAGCAATSNPRPAKPALPVLESVRIAGARICGSQTSTAAASTFNFECPDLPASVPSGWRLTPGWETATDKAGRARSNRTVVLNVSGPLATEIDVELVRGGTQLNLPLDQVASGNPGRPGEVAADRQVGVATFDEARKRMWIVEVTVSTCADSRHLRIYNRAARDPERSAPLDVYLVRDPAEQVCIGQAGANPATRAGIGDPANPRVAGGCAGGGTGKPFQICETCPALQPPVLSVYSAGQYCDWEEVLSVYGYGEGTSRSQFCRLSQVGSREACEGK